MTLGFSEDQRTFRDVVARFLADKSQPTAVRELMVTRAGYDAAVWRQLSEELGLLGTHLPEQFGGFGYGPVEMGIIAEEMGRFLYCGPFFASAVMAGYAVLGAGNEADKLRLLPGIADGSTIAALVLDNLNSPDHVGQQITANAVADGYQLSGVASMVVDAQVASVLIVAAITQQGVSLFEVDPQANGVSIEALEVLDPTRKLSAVGFTQTPARLLGDAGQANLSTLWDSMVTMLAHEMIGGAQALFTSTLDYMKLRVQFGRAIGSFQSLKHRAADLLLELELAKAATHEAARVLATGKGDSYAPNMAKAMASDAYINIAKQAIQLRGGIGFTWEEDTHLWFKRAKSSEVFLGTSNWHRERMMQQIEETANV
ncbi:MAG: alkylation response protein AidB-like acyl-CoA dehydrogenase [Oceanicoccus sp.]|jgi:alkylation response protein AidB-like acyl-CoA dehydrogenase